MSQTDESFEVGFVRKLVEMHSDAGKMANLRRGVRVENPRADARVVSTMAHWLHGVGKWDLDRFYWVASLFALVHTGAYPPVWMKKHLDEPKKVWERKNIGASFRHLSELERRERNLDRDKKTSTEARFVKLLDSDWEDLPNRLRQAVRLLASRHGGERERIHIDWVRLLYDIAPRRFNAPERYIQENWAQSFWGTKAKTEEEEQKDEVKNTQ